MFFCLFLCSISLSPLTIISAAFALDVDDGEEHLDEWVTLDECVKLVNKLRFWIGSTVAIDDFNCVELTIGDAISSFFDVTIILLMWVSDISSSTLILMLRVSKTFFE